MSPSDQSADPRSSPPPDTSRSLEVRERFARVRRRIEAAADRAGRQPGEITLLGASKYQSPEVVAAALRAGLVCLGENYVQEAATKQPEIAALLGSASPGLPPLAPPRWHMIGALQRNKARLAVTLFDVIETLDRTSLAMEIDKRARTAEKQMDAFIQVNLSRESQKAGIREEDLQALLESCAPLANLRITGLMTIPAAAKEPEDNRRHFAQLRALRDRSRGSPGAEALEELSMGMSQDFEIAIEEGATLVRVGRDLFGEREGRKNE